MRCTVAARRPLAEARTGPLDGIVVVDLSRILAGPYCSMLLADMGATVIKVEGPAGDDTRQFRPPTFEDQSTYFMSVNRNKRSIVADFRNPDDLELVKDLIAEADVVIENFRAGSLAKFGLDYEALAAGREDLVYATITGFGDGAGAQLLGYDLLIQSLSGFMDITGPPGGEGYRAGFAIFDVFAGLHTAIGVLAALTERASTGVGQHVKTNLLMSALSSMVNQTQAVASGVTFPQRLGNEHPSLYPYAPFAAQDRPIVIAVGNDAQFARMCRVIGREDLLEDPRFASNLLRNENRPSLKIEIEAAVSQRPAHEWWERFNEADVPSAPIQTVAEGLQTAQELGLNPVARTREEDVAVVSNPLTFSRSEVEYVNPPPGLGDHTEEITELITRIRRERRKTRSEDDT